MNFIDPFSMINRPIVLTEFYPFNRVNPSVDYFSSASLKLECLIQKECTLPGAMIIEDPLLRKLILDNRALLVAGVLNLDLRNSVDSFNALVLEKFGASASREMWETADILDENCKNVIHFDPTKSSSKYKSDLKDFLIKLRGQYKTGHEIKSIDRLIGKVDNFGSLTYSDACALRTNIKNIDEKIFAIVKFLYCTCGSEFVNGIAQVPHSLWEAVHLGSVVAHLNPETATDSTMLSVAHAVILEHFGVNAKAFDRLSAETILNLKSDGATQKTISIMDSTIKEVQTHIIHSGEVPQNSLKELSECRADLSRKIKEICLKQKRRASFSQNLEIGLEESVSFGLDLVDNLGLPVGLVKKGVLRIGQAISRLSPKLASADITFNPIPTYITRLQNRIGTTE